MEFWIFPSDAGYITFGDLGSTIDTKIKIIRNADNSLTAWVWYNSQWEWAGNTAGFTTGTHYDLDLTVQLFWYDEISLDKPIYVKGSIKNINVNSGIINVL